MDSRAATTSTAAAAMHTLLLLQVRWCLQCMQGCCCCLCSTHQPYTTSHSCIGANEFSKLRNACIH